LRRNGFKKAGIANIFVVFNNYSKDPLHGKKRVFPILQQTNQQKTAYM
jgi:hypothetical protein